MKEEECKYLVRRWRIRESSIIPVNQDTHLSVTAKEIFTSIAYYTSSGTPIKHLLGSSRLRSQNRVKENFIFWVGVQMTIG